MDLMLDSGAYSAWTKQQEIDIHAYIDYAIQNKKYVDHIINLDVIPGAFGKRATPAEVEASAKKGWENCKLMEKEGLKPIPIFHQDENFKWLHKMVNEGYEYIGISPSNDKPTPAKKVWLDEVFSEIVDEKGYPVIKAHGFGMTSVELMYRYPWHSCDSLTWILIAAYGGIFIPKYKNRGFVFDEPPITVIVSEVPLEPKFNSMLDPSEFPDIPRFKDKRHYRLLGKTGKGIIDEWLSRYEFTMKEIADDFKIRSKINVRFFLESEKRMKLKPFKSSNRKHLFLDRK